MTDVNESCLIWTSHVPHSRFGSHKAACFFGSHRATAPCLHMNASCTICLSHVGCEWVMSHTNESDEGHVVGYSRNSSVLINIRWLHYGVATISRLLKITGLFCKRALYKKRYSAEETYNFKEPTNRSHPIIHYTHIESLRHMCMFVYYLCYYALPIHYYVTHAWWRCTVETVFYSHFDGSTNSMAALRATKGDCN